MGRTTAKLPSLTFQLVFLSCSLWPCSEFLACGSSTPSCLGRGFSISLRQLQFKRQARRRPYSSFASWHNFHLALCKESNWDTRKAFSRKFGVSLAVC